MQALLEPHAPAAAGVPRGRIEPALLEPVAPADVGLRPDRLEAMCSIIARHIDEKRYPGAQVAVARHGKLALLRTFGLARTVPEPQPANDDTLWRIYSNTKVLIATGIWLLVEDGRLSFNDPVALHIPEFAKAGKGDITIHQVLTHQGGFPSALNPIDPLAWEDHGLLRRLVCDIALEWAPGTRVCYHRRSAHWVAAVLIEALSGMDYRAFLRKRLLEQANLQRHIYVGLPRDERARVADSHTLSADGRSHARDATENTPEYQAAGIPGTGAIATATGMAAYYQMLVNGGRANGAQILSPRLIEYVTRNFTGERTDEHFGMPMHRGLGPHSRGSSESIRGLGTLAHPSTFGHGGVGTSYCWADPASGVSFAYLTNSQLPDPWHSHRLDLISNCVHSAIGES
jgi:CubicO group peptidase (beta-lactamase class C family)